MDAAVDFTLEQARGFEHAKMFGDSWEGKGEGLSEFGDGRLALGKAGEDGAAGGIGESGEGGVKRSAVIFNHSV
jgi:hypothetical protein